MIPTKHDIRNSYRDLLILAAIRNTIDAESRTHSGDSICDRATGSYIKGLNSSEIVSGLCILASAGAFVEVTQECWERGLVTGKDRYFQAHVSEHLNAVDAEALLMELSEAELGTVEVRDADEFVPGGGMRTVQELFSKKIPPRPTTVIHLVIGHNKAAEKELDLDTVITRSWTPGRLLARVVLDSAEPFSKPNAVVKLEG